MTSYNFLIITNYAETIRTDADLNPVGLQTECLALDNAGIPIAYTDTLLKHNTNQQIVFPLTSPYTYTTTKDIKAISGDDSSLTITHSDDTTTIAP